MPSTESSSTPATGVSPEGRRTLLGVARQTVIQRAADRPTPVINARDYPPELRQVRATFVTLRVNEALRGCIGTCQAVRPLVEDVAHNAAAAASMDPRFPPLTMSDIPGLHLEISLLSVPEPLPVHSEEELLDQVRPGVDGLLLEEGPHRGTLLPGVWEALPEPRDFVRQLKLKAGLPADYWSPDIAVFRYTAESIEED